MADLASILGAPFSNGMSAVGGGELGKNASEASTFLLVGLFLAVPLAYQFFMSLRTGWRRADWLVASMLVAALLTGHVSAGIAALVAASLVVGATVNPVRLGVFDLNETSVAAELRQIQSRDPGAWIAMGDPAIALVVESGVPAFSGYQSSPTPEMWSAIDPDGRFEDSWNRLGLVAWSPQQGPIEVTSPGVDVVMVTFDSCGEFAQGNIKHILAMGELDQPCLELVSRQRPGKADFYFYDVTPVHQEPGAPEAGLD